jgi:hypothetical protein
MKKRTYYINTTILVLTMLCSMMLTVTAQIDNSASIGAWQPPQNFVDPVTSKIQEYSAQGLTNDQITVELENLGMGF